MLTDAPTIPFNGVTVSADLNYKTVDLTLGYCSHLCHDLDLTTFGGLRFLRLDQSLNISSGERSPKLLWNSELDAAGIILGAHTHWTICGPWSLYGVLTGSLLKGDAEANYSNEVNGGPFHEEECLGILGSNISAGISYSSCLFSVPFDVSVGYEGHYWNNLPVRRRVANGIATPGTGGYLLLHGWELRIDACF
jgi:hypothetical protein